MKFFRPSHLWSKYFIAKLIHTRRIFHLPKADFIEKSTCRSKCFFMIAEAGLEPTTFGFISQGCALLAPQKHSRPARLERFALLLSFFTSAAYLNPPPAAVRRFAPTSNARRSQTLNKKEKICPKDRSVVAEAGLEPTTFGLWARRATDCSTPRYLILPFSQSALLLYYFAVDLSIVFLYFLYLYSVNRIIE